MGKTTEINLINILFIYEYMYDVCGGVCVFRGV